MGNQGCEIFNMNVKRDGTSKVFKRNSLRDETLETKDS